MIWIYLFFFHHGFWRRREFLPPLQDASDPQVDFATWPSIISITPARNEAAVIKPAFSSLLAQNYPGRFEVLLVDDNSHDHTRELAQSVIDAHDAQEGTEPRAQIITAPPLQEGWSGKLWALHQGLTYLSAQGRSADYIWFSDADIAHDPDVLCRQVIKAVSSGRAFVSIMVTLNCTRFWERVIIPAFIYYFQMLYPFHATANPRSSHAGGAGGSVLIPVSYTHLTLPTTPYV